MRVPPVRRSRLVGAALVALLACGTALAAGAHTGAHEGCGQHHPLVAAQHAQLRRRLAQQGEPAAGGGGGRGSPSPSALRIVPVYQLSGLEPGDAARVSQQLVPAAIAVLARSIKVLRPPRGGLLKASALFGDGQQTCLSSRVDAYVARAGVSGADLVLYVTSDAPSCLPGMVAVATACDVDPGTRRPTLGALNVCPGALGGLAGLAPGSEAESEALGRLVEVAVHEAIHVLGFGATYYPDWLRANGTRYGERDVVRQVDGRPYLVTPKVTAVAREYFGCASLPGAPLENEGPSFSAASHFEYRLMQRELMGPARPIDRSRTRLSAFTLAALDDTGWYVIDYSHAEPLEWGRGAGCAFVRRSCWDYARATPNQPYFCGAGATNATRCTPEAAGWGVCRASAFSDNCLLVGKYAAAGPAAAVPRGTPPGAADGREARCYSPPQLAALAGAPGRAGAAGSPLLPFLGGSFGAARRDICYNLLAPAAGRDGARAGGAVAIRDGRGALPEDLAAAAAAAKQAGGAGGGGAPQVRPPKERGAAGPGPLPGAGFVLIDELLPPAHSQHAGGAERAASAARVAAACVSVPPHASPGASSRRGAGRRLLAALAAALGDSGRRLAAAAAGAGAAAAAGPGARAGAAAAAAGAGACTSSPVLCFRSSCTPGGQLLITAAPPGGSGAGTRFACPSGAVVDLAAALPGQYTWGFLQCPSNALVCEAMGCERCSGSGGYCARGRCVCHMERYGPGCAGTLVPRLQGAAPSSSAG
ncbi:Invadolysin [Scenedesmus sp. PABB004]|nr:Invadolysin [Scenedesmus sp. PABB004]